MAEAAEQYRIESTERENYAVSLVANLTERTFRESGEVPETLLQPCNPDDLYALTGDYSIYEKMGKDDQIDVSLRLKRDLVLGSGFEIEEDDEIDSEIIDDTKIALVDDQCVPFEDQLEEILSAYKFGFSLTEKIFARRDDGTLTLKALKTRHPATWEIHQDERGNVSKYLQKASNRDISIPERSLIHYVNNRGFQNPYGLSDLRSAHTAWRVKLEIVKFYAIFLEKSASPTPVARYDKSAPKDSVTAIHNAIQKLQVKSALTIPKDIEMDFVEAKSNGEAYEKAINLFNTFIGRSLMVPDLLGFSGSETSGGSFSLGENQMNVFFRHIERRRKTLERIVDQHIIKPIVVFNHGIQEKYPKFKFKPLKDEDAKEFAKVWIEAVKGKFYKPSDEEINKFREFVKMPTGDVERPDPIQPPGFGAPPSTPDNTSAPSNQPPNESDDEEQENFVFRQLEESFQRPSRFYRHKNSAGRD